MVKRFTIDLPSRLLLSAKRKAIAERRSLDSLIEEGLRAVINAAEPPAEDVRKGGRF
jgi:hypothetical protein